MSRCRALVPVGAITALAAALALFQAPAAQALSQRGHMFDGVTFPGPGTGAIKLSAPAGVAVDEGSQDVYVVDSGNQRIDRFDATGRFISTWGFGVANGAAEYQICEAGCQAGIAGGKPEQFRDPGEIAVDNSTQGVDPSRGDVYVIANTHAGHGRLFKFSPDGEFLGRVNQEGFGAWEGVLEGVAVDSSGRLWVYRADEGSSVVERFSDAAKNGLEAANGSPLPCASRGFGVSLPGEVLYADHERESPVGGCAPEDEEAPRTSVPAELAIGEELTTVRGELTAQMTTGLAVDEASGPESGEVYVDNATSVADFAPDGALIQRFGAGALQSGTGIALDEASGSVYVADAASNQVDVFPQEEPHRPSVESLYVSAKTETSATLRATVDPDGSDTHYFFQYGTADCQESPGSCTDVPTAPGAEIGGGFADVAVVAELHGLDPGATYHYDIRAENEHGESESSNSFGTVTTLPASAGLLPDGRAWELVSPPEKHGSSVDPLTLEGGVIQAAADGQAITYVADGPIGTEVGSNRAPEVTQLISHLGPEGWLSQDVNIPHSAGEGLEPGGPPAYQFFSNDLALSLVQPPIGTEPRAQPPLSPPVVPGEVQEKTLYVRADSPLEPTPGEEGLFKEAAANGPSYLAPGYLALVNEANDETRPPNYGGKLRFLTATPDLDDVLFASAASLKKNSGETGNLYEWSRGGSLVLVSVLPDNEAAESPQLGGLSANVRGAVSENGTRVIFSSESVNSSGNTVHHLYLRDTEPGHEQTLSLNAPAPGIDQVEAEEGEVGYQAATPDGSAVYFTDTAPLTLESNQQPILEQSPADLYECEVSQGVGGKLGCRLKDLTPAPSPSEAADVLNLIPGAAEDGSYVYFAANGKLTPDAIEGDCVHAQEPAPPDARCNLYAVHEGHITFIAAVSNEDSPDWGSLEGLGTGGVAAIEPRPDLADLTSRVSPNGRYLAFMSNEPLTGYDNQDANPAAEGARDEEVYLYDALEHRLTCVSCNMHAPSTGVHDIEQSGEGEGLVVDRRRDWVDQKSEAGEEASHWLAGSIPGWVAQEQVELADHQPRYLLNDGRVYFNSPDDLVPAATNGKEDVYQFEPEGVGGCAEPAGCVGLISSGTAARESAFIDASETGDDAFFVTAAPLVGIDRDTNYDVYDGHVCSGAAPCLNQSFVTSEQCQSASACNSAPYSTGSPSPPASTTFSGQPSVVSPGRGVLHSKTSTNAHTSKLAAALKSCREHYKRSRSRRKACEARARKRYASKSSSRSPKAKRKR